MRLQNKILILLVPLVVLPILALGWTAYALLMEDARDRMEDTATNLLEQISFHTESQLRTARSNALLFASTDLVRQYVTTTSAERQAELEPEVLNLLYDYQLSYPEYYEIRIISPAGREMLRTVIGNVKNLTNDEAATDYFIAASNSSGAIYTTFLNNPDNDKLALLISKPLRFVNADDTSKIPEVQQYGFLMLTINPSFLARQSEKQRIGASGDVFFTDARGAILFHPDGARVGENIDPEIYMALNESEGKTRYVEDEYAGESAYYHRIKLHDWLYAFAVYRESEFAAKSLNLGRSVMLIVCVAILLTMALLFGGLKTLLIKPIQKLGQAVTEMGRGQLLVPIGIDSDDELGELANTFRQMGENLNRNHEQMRYVAYHDSLTGLPNRLMFKDYLKRAIAEAKRNLQELSILFLDLDNFKRINDTMGHQAGDRLLEAFADRLSASMRGTDVLSRSQEDTQSAVMARMAGDEFTILLPRTTGAADAQKVARRVLDLLSEPFMINKQELFISTSMGIALFPDDGTNADDLMKHADIAMYHAKKSGRNNYQYFSSKFNEEAVFKLKIESKLRHAVENNELEVYYQPQMVLASGNIVAAEALLRWHDEELGMIPPDVFIPIAEEYGLIVPITEWLINAICRQAQDWRDRYGYPMTMAINISAVHFCGNNLEELISKTLQATGYDHSLLEIELTETSILQDPDQAISTLKRIQEMGLQTTLDDFGTGYSSLNYLMRLPLNKLKIDRSFVMNMDEDGKGAAIVSAIIAMAHSLGLEVIAEGVEEYVQLELLRKLKCDIVQGYYIAHPLPAAEFEEVIASSAKRIA